VCTSIEGSRIEALELEYRAKNKERTILQNVLNTTLEMFLGRQSIALPGRGMGVRLNPHVFSNEVATVP